MSFVSILQKNICVVVVVVVVVLKCLAVQKVTQNRLIHSNPFPLQSLPPSHLDSLVVGSTMFGKSFCKLKEEEVVLISPSASDI